ncbi:CPBP family intramembrane glutamic endopeptidase [Lysobacter tyrosinilyticus]
MATESVTVLKNPIGPARQWFICLLMCAAALAVAALSGHAPEALFSGGLTIPAQALVGLGLGVAACINSFIGYKFTAHRPTTQHTIQSYSRLNLAGLNPLWIALAAGIGEELLFRGALQPVMGIWLSSLIFVLAHTRAYRFTSLSKRTLVQAVGLFAASLALAAVAKYVGLLAAMILHTAIDVAGLYAVRYASASPAAA